MTDEELSMEFVLNYPKIEKGELLTTKDLQNAYLAGLEAGRPKWHKVADGDLPKENKRYLCKIKEFVGSGISYECFEMQEKFYNAAAFLTSRGNEPFIPSVLPAYEDVPHEDYLHICYAMIDICDAIYMLRDWQQSKGARLELQYAADWKKDIYYQDPATIEENFPVRHDLG